MSYDIIVRFPNKELADEFCMQMSDGLGEEFCDFSFWHRKIGTSGCSNDDFERIAESGKEVYFVHDVLKI
jgi:hypothetical protein